MSSRREVVSPTAEQDFGKQVERGKTVRFAREDHTHGTPGDPVIDVLSKILGSANKVRIDSNGDGTITITLPGSIQLDGATADRLLATDSNRRTVSANLAAWIAGTANQITIADDGDGSVTISIPNNLTIQNILHAGTTLGFYGAGATTKTVVTDPGAVATTQTAGAAYTANEQTMLANLKADVVALQGKLTALINALQGYGLV